MNSQLYHQERLSEVTARSQKAASDFQDHVLTCTVCTDRELCHQGATLDRADREARLDALAAEHADESPVEHEREIIAGWKAARD